MIYGTPKKQLLPPKNQQLTIRFTKELFNVLITNAEVAGLSRQEMIFNDTEILQIFRNLGHYGANLIRNQGGFMVKQMGKEIRDCISEIYKIRDAIREMVGEYRGNH